MEDPHSYSRLGKEAYAKGQYRKAIGYFENALAILRGTLPKGHHNIRVAEANLAGAKRRGRK